MSGFLTLLTMGCAAGFIIGFPIVCIKAYKDNKKNNGGKIESQKTVNESEVTNNAEKA